jgi:hypothetical protein
LIQDKHFNNFFNLQVQEVNWGSLISHIAPLVGDVLGGRDVSLFGALIVMGVCILHNL